MRLLYELYAVGGANACHVSSAEDSHYCHPCGGGLVHIWCPGDSYFSNTAKINLVCAGNNTQPTFCPTGQVTDSTGACIKCAPGTAPDKSGHSCERCKVGTYSKDGTACIECDAAYFYADEGGLAQCKFKKTQEDCAMTNSPAISYSYTNVRDNECIACQPCKSGTVPVLQSGYAIAQACPDHVGCAPIDKPVTLDKVPLEPRYDSP